MLIEQLVSRGKVEKIFYENTWEHDTLLQNYLSGAIRIEDYREPMQSKYVLPFKPAIPDSLHFPYYTYVQQEYMNLENDNYLPFFKRAKKYQYHEKLIPIDIGTQTLYLGLYHMAKITKALNKGADPIINNFLDSIRMKCRSEYARMTLTTDDETAFKKMKRQSLLF